MTGRIRVAVVYGGRSSEHGVSVVSAGSVLAALDPARYDVVPVGITPSGQWLITDTAPEALRISGRTLPEVEKGTAVVLPPDPTSHALVSVEPGAGVELLQSVDVVFPVLHGRFGEDGTIQGLLEMAGIPYVGPGVFASAAGMDKEFTKILLRAAGLDVGRFTVVRQGRPYSAVDIQELGLPVFVKPARAGSSVGITRVDDWSALDAAIEVAFGHDTKVLIEAAVTGREIECGVLENADGLPEASLPAEIRLMAGHDWYDFEAKYLDDACEFDIPAHLPAEVIAAVQRRRLPGVHRARLRRALARRLLRHRRRPGRRQRDQHHARLHADLDVPADVGGLGRGLPDAGRSPDRGRPAPRPGLTGCGRNYGRASTSTPSRRWSRPPGRRSARCARGRPGPRCCAAR